jgi:hypothetical protein
MRAAHRTEERNQSPQDRDRRRRIGKQCNRHVPAGKAFGHDAGTYNGCRQ